MLTTVFQDESLLVFNKPPGMVVDKSQTQMEGTLEDILRDEYQINLDRGGIVHRLDKDTSGLIVVAKTQTALNVLQAQFKNREVKKKYLALVQGLLTESKVVEGAIARNPANREKFIVMDDDGVGTEGKEAVTEFKPLSHLQFTGYNLQTIFNNLNKIQMKKLERMGYGKFTLVECNPLTGRTHQIRVHLKYIGFPIVGDGRYGGRKVVRLDHRWCKRQFLHAANLSFLHPVTGKLMEFESPLPEDLKLSLKMLQPV